MIKLRSWLEGAGLALLYFVPHIALILDPGSHIVYHQLLPITTILRGMLLDLALLTVVCGAAFGWLHSGASQRRDWLQLGVLSAVGWVLGRILVFSTREPQIFALLKSTLPVVSHLWVILPMVAAMVLIYAPQMFRQSVKVLYVVLGGAGYACVLVVVPRLVLGSFASGPWEARGFDHTPASVSASMPKGPRIIWLLFDEMSYDQTFEHRRADLHLPAFDQLRAESTYFSDLQPAGFYTERVIPSLFAGEFFPTIRISKQGALAWRSASTDAWNKFDPQQTVFGEAHRLGWTTGVAGWFNPYCRILAPVLDRCESVDRYDLEEDVLPHISSRQSTLENALYGLPVVSPLLIHFEHQSQRQLHRDDYDEMLKQAESLIQDARIQFAFIHLPVPHLPGIYLRPESTTAHTPDYLDNMALADQTLAKLRATIAATPQADDTVLIVSSDHSWRAQLNHGGKGWTQEEEAASHGGQFDPRPVLMVHSPGETTSNRITSATNLMIVHSLLEDLLAHKRGDRQDLGKKAPSSGPAQAAK